jgi:primosomal protein N' (replication factor Y)
MSDRFAQVVLPLPLFEPYTYLVPDTLADRVVPGARVVVPVRKRQLVGIVSAVGAEAPNVAAKEILAAPDPEPALTAPLLRTAEWMAGYYGAPVGLALRAMLPAALWGASRVHLVVTASGPAGRPGGLAEQLLDWVGRKGGEAPLDTAARAFKRPLWEVADRLVRIGAAELRVVAVDPGRGQTGNRHLTLAAERLTLLERESRFVRRPRQRRLYDTLEQLGGSASAAHLSGELGFGDGVQRALVESGLAGFTRVERLRDPFAGEAGSPPPGPLTPEQAHAVASIEGLEPAGGALLFGVTGSGKTLVYLEAVRRALETGRGAIVLVPEIGLTPQLVSRVRGMFGDEVAVLHSALSDGERADAWRVLRRGARRVAVGARSAVFAPVAKLGLLVMDEEHETSYKNGEAPRYQTRDVAGVRARLEGARLVLGSATPSIETMAECRSHLLLLRLPHRIGDRPLPPVQLLDLRTAPLVATGHAVAWSEALDSAVAETLARGEQAILLLNRRGYAAFVQCPSCGQVPECPDCSISLTLHRTPPGMRCHYCGRHAPVPTVCQECGHPVQRARGVGTQQLEELVGARFPAARVARMDHDTTSTKWGHHRILEQIGTGAVDILLGTQMIAKGMDFPSVTLVGVVDADTALHLPDFRAAERTFQLVAQVAGRAGRGPKGGRVIVQTRSPEHPALQFASMHDTEGFLRVEGEQRKNPPYPPETNLVNVVVSAEEEGATAAEANRIADWFGQLVLAQRLEIGVLGPAPCPLARVKGRWRWHVVLKGRAEAIGRVVRYAAPRLESRGTARVVLDRDPVSLL